MIVASEEIEFIGGGPLDGAVRTVPPQGARISHSVVVPRRHDDTGPLMHALRIEWHLYVRFGPRREGGSYYKYLGVER